MTLGVTGVSELVLEVVDLEASERFVRLYHMLWELCHVCFEHPGLLKAPAAEECTDEVCITCSDEGRLAEVVTVWVMAAEVLPVKLLSPA